MSPLCSICDMELSADDRGPCCRCGGTAKTFRMEFFAKALSDSSVCLEHRHEYYQKNYGALVVGITVVVVSSVLGFFLQGWVGSLIGLFIGLLSLWAIPSLRTKVVEKTRYGSRS